MASGGRHLKGSSVLRLLLEHGADVNVRTHGGWTSLHFASLYEAPEDVRVLLEHGADVEAKRDNGKTTLQFAISRGQDKIVKLLREHGAK